MSYATTVGQSDTMLGPTEVLYGTELGPGAMVGAYVIEEPRSRGGSGVVYRATGPSNEPAAVKVLHASLVESPAALQRFEQEVGLIQRIQSPAVVKIFAWGDLTDGRPYVAMEWLEGPTLDEALRAGGPFDPATAMVVAGEICEALAAAHAAGVVHRDLKGSNVMLMPAEEGRRRIKLFDFGIAKRVDLDAKLTGTGVRVGTPTHMAPEQILGQRISPATDVYALGVLLFQMLTAQFPFRAESTLELESMHLHAPAPWVGDFAGVPDALSEIVQRCMAKRPAQRYASMEEIAEDLRIAAEKPGRPISAFRVQGVEAAGLLVVEQSDVEGSAPGAAGVEGRSPHRGESSVLATARRDCEAEGWMTTWVGDHAFLAAAILPSRADGALGLRLRALRLSLRVAHRSDGRATLSVLAHAAKVIVLFVQGSPQIVGGALFEAAEALLETPGLVAAGTVLATSHALAGLEGELELTPWPHGEGISTVLSAQTQPSTPDSGAGRSGVAA